MFDLAARWTDPDARVTLGTVHRFTRTVRADDGAAVAVPDTEYAELTLAMRSGDDLDSVFDTLVTRGQIQIHATKPPGFRSVASSPQLTARQHIGGHRGYARTGRRVECSHPRPPRRHWSRRRRAATTTRAGQRIGVGDRVATRRNDSDLDVANRDGWTVTRVGRHGELTVTALEHGERQLSADYVRSHVELAYATTVHGVQGDTTTTAHLVLGEHTGARSPTSDDPRSDHQHRSPRRRHLDHAREQWIAAFGRDRADLGPAHAAQLAIAEAARYAQPRPLDRVLAELHAAWTLEQICVDRLDHYRPRRNMLREFVVRRRDQSAELFALEIAYEQAQEAAYRAAQRAELTGAVVTGDAARIRGALSREWRAQREVARHAAQTVLDAAAAGSGDTAAR